MYKKIQATTNETVKANPKKLLYIEDDVIVAMLQEKKLTQLGYEVVHVNTGEKAVELINSGEYFDLGLFDIDLGNGIDGPEAARKILMQQNIPIVFMSSHTEPDVIDRVETITSYGYIVKGESLFGINQTLKVALRLFDANQKVANSEIQFKSLFQNTNNSMSIYNIIYDANGIPVDYEYLAVNPKFEEATGLTMQDFAGKTLLQMYPRTEQVWLDTLKQVVLTGKPITVSSYSVELDRYMELSVYLPQKGQLAFVGIDVTERERAEIAKNDALELLEASNNLNKQIIESSNQGIIIYGLDLKYQKWNTFMENLTGIPSEQVIGRQPQDVFPFLDNAGVVNRLQKVLDGEDTDPVNFPYEVKATGKTGWTTDTSVPLKNAEGEIIGVLGIVQDTTKDRLATEKINATKELYSQFIARSPIYAYIKEVTPTQSIVLQASDNFKEMIGMTGQEIIGKTMAEIFPAEFAEKMTADDFAVASGGKVLALDEELNGRTYSTIKFPITQDGKTFLAGYTIDITERKQAEIAINQKDKEFRRISEHVPGLLYQFTRRPDGTYYVPIASVGIKNIFGCSPEDVLESFDRIGRVIFPEDRERVLKEIEYSAKHLTDFTCEFRVQIPGKPIQWIYSNSKPEKLADGSVTWYGFNTDITEQKVVEEANAQLNILFRSSFDAISDGMVVTNSDREIIMANKGMLTTFGYSEEDLIGKTTEILYASHEEYLRQGRERYNLTAEEKKRPFLVSYKRKDGTIFQGETLGTVIKDSQGNTIHYFGLMRDVTGRILREVRIKSLLAEKELILKEVHHRIKNNMGTMLSLLNIQKQKIAEQTAIDALDDAINRLTTMQVLYDKLYRSDNIQSLSARDYLPELIEEIVRNYSKGGKVEIDTTMIDDIILAAKASSEVGIIINELLTNIMKYAFDNIDNPVIKVSMQKNEDDLIELIITDNGVGLPKDFNLNNPTGFGMQLITLLSEQLEGTFTISNDLNGGAIAKLVLKLE